MPRKFASVPLRFRAVSATSATHHRTAPNARPWTSSQGRLRSSTTALRWNRVCRSQARSISGRAAYTAFFCLLASPLQGRFFHVVHFALCTFSCCMRWTWPRLPLFNRKRVPLPARPLGFSISFCKVRPLPTNAKQDLSKVTVTIFLPMR